MSTHRLSVNNGPGHEFGEQRGRGRKTSAWLTLAVVGVVGIGGGTAYWLMTPGPRADGAGVSPAPVATVEVSRETLTATKSWGGQLGHGTPYVVRAKGEGTITGLAEHGSLVGRGTELYRLDEQPVIALIGSIPMYRDLSAGATGADVEQLETNLAKLGYEGFDVDHNFTRYTALAVQRWQQDTGADRTGSVGHQDVVFLPRDGRVDGLKVALGDTVTPSTEILGVSRSDQIVSLEVAVVDRDLVDPGTKLSVRLPGGDAVKATVSLAAVVEDTSASDDRGGGDQEAPGADDTTTWVEATLEHKVDEALLGSPVDVVVDVEARHDVLVVPVTALLALAEGGLGLEVVKDDGTRLIVAVEAGMFTDGKVEVSGGGIDEGTVVVVAGR